MNFIDTLAVHWDREDTENSFSSLKTDIDDFVGLEILLKIKEK